MATKKHGVLATSKAWKKHLRPFWRRRFWKQHRRQERAVVRGDD